MRLCRPELRFGQINRVPALREDVRDETQGKSMRTQSEVEGLIRRLCQEIGFDPTDVIQIKPIDGGWENALSYNITRRDGKQTTIYRRDLDDRNELALKNALRGFR